MDNSCSDTNDVDEKPREVSWWMDVVDSAKSFGADNFKDMRIAYFCYTRALLALLIFMFFLGLWPMHVFGILDVLLYAEVNLGIYPLYKKCSEGPPM